MLRAAYHLGNRHVALELGADRLLLEPDHVLADMLRAMHLEMEETQAAFEPEAGAYAAHESGAAHPHAQGRTPASTAAPVHGKPLPIGVALAPAPHVHGPGCKHEHGHHHR